jgi:hypothetical protein
MININPGIPFQLKTLLLITHNLILMSRIDPTENVMLFIGVPDGPPNSSLQL